MTKLFTGVWGLVLALAVSGCDDSGDGGNRTDPVEALQCESIPEACGGNIDGSWRIVSTCVTGDPFATLTAGLSDACSGLIESAEIVMTGTVTLNGGTSVSTTTTDLDAVFRYTPECLSSVVQSEVTEITDALCAQIGTSGSDPADGRATTCTLEGRDCVCAMTQTRTSNKTSSYTINGASYVSEDGDTSQFCVTGDRLQVISTDEDTGIVSVMTLSRQ